METEEERREKEATRARIQQLLDEGWEIDSRFPLKLVRGNGSAEVRPNGSIVYGTGNDRRSSQDRREE